MLKYESRPCQVQGYEGEFLFRCYAQDFEEFQNGAAPVPVAIVENVNSGQVLSVYAGKVMFTTSIAERREKLKSAMESAQQEYLHGVGDPT